MITKSTGPGSTCQASAT